MLAAITSISVYIGMLPLGVARCRNVFPNESKIASANLYRTFDALNFSLASSFRDPSNFSETNSRGCCLLRTVLAVPDNMPLE